MNYKEIKPILVSEEWEGMMVKCKFQAEGQETPLETMGTAVPDQNEIMANAGKSAIKSGIISTVISMLTGMLSRMLGGTGGYLAGTAASQLGHRIAGNSNNPMNIMGNISEEKKQAAVVAAFNNVASYYTKDANGRWIYKK